MMVTVECVSSAFMLCEVRSIVGAPLCEVPCKENNHNGGSTFIAAKWLSHHSGLDVA